MSGLWMIRALRSSPKQAMYFGQQAPRPYLMFRTKLVVDPNIIRDIVLASYNDTPVVGVEYYKHFDLDEGEAFEFDYAKALFNSYNNSYFYREFYKVVV